MTASNRNDGKIVLAIENFFGLSKPGDISMSQSR